MVRIILIHPGSTDYDQQGRIQGTLDVPLNAQGSVEVARAIDGLRGVKLEAVYAPASQPALQTAEAIAEAFNIKLRKLDQMHNLDHGLWQGMRVDEVRRRQPKVYRQWQESPATVCPPDGEMLDAATERVRAVLTRLLKRHKEGVIGLVVPEPLATLVRCFVSPGQLGDLWKANDQRGRWEILEIHPASLAQSG